MRNYRVAVREWGDRVVFLRRIEPGGTDRSYGIHVARLAGLPAGVIERARTVLAGFETAARPLEPRLDVPPAPRQLTLFAPAEDPMRAQLRGLDLDALRPLDALVLLTKWKAAMPSRLESDGFRAHDRKPMS